MNSWHEKIQKNDITCYIDYNIDEFVVHIRYPLGTYTKDCIWLYPCVFNNKPLKLIPADRKRLGYNQYGKWAIHYL